MNNLQCPACEKQITSDPILVETWNEYKILECPYCKIHFANPLTQAGDYIGGEPYIEYEWQHRQFLENLPLKSGRLLDIGSGSGYFLSLVQKKGFEVYGIEINPRGVEMAKEKFGLQNVYCCPLKDFHSQNIAPEGYFDIVTLFECLEHLDCPAETVRLIQKFLKPGGLLVLSVPNRDRLLTPYRSQTDYPPAHQTRWNKNILKDFLERSGYSVQTLNVKDFDGAELSRPILEETGFKLASGLSQAGVQSQSKSLVSIGSFLSKFKKAVVVALTTPLGYFLRFCGAEGFGLYCVSKKKQ